MWRHNIQRLFKFRNNYTRVFLEEKEKKRTQGWMKKANISIPLDNIS